MARQLEERDPIIRHGVILCHPAEHSFNHSVARAYCDEVRKNGQEYVLRDLYASGFDPVLRDEERPMAGSEPKADVARELMQLDGCNIFTLIYPVWFGSAPAMLKGYVERVFGSGVTPYNVMLRNRTGFLTNRWLFSITSSGSKEIWLDEQGQISSMRQGFDRYIAHAFGMHLEKHIHFGNILPNTKARWVDEYLCEVREETKRICAMLADQAHHPQPAASDVATSVITPSGT